MRLPSPRHARPRAAACIAAIALALVLVPARAEGAVGTYTVTVGSTTSFPGWTNLVDRGHFRTDGQKVDTGSGAYPAWSSRRWRLVLPHGLTLAGGHVTGSAAAPNDAIQAEVRQGTASGAVRVLRTVKDENVIDQGIAAGGDWVDIGLHATAGTTLGSNGTNWVKLSTLTVVLADAAAPVLVLTTTPSPTQWHGPGECVAWALSATDTGAGLVAGDEVNVTTAHRVESWAYVHRTGLQPGWAAGTHAGCVPGSSAAQGTNVVNVAVHDGSGRTDVQSLVVRFDLTPPDLDGLDASDLQVDEPLPTLHADASDADSGLSTVEAWVDGDAATVVRDGAHVSITPASPLGVGAHALRVRATDAVGNAADVTRTLAVGDATPPDLVVSAPGASGGPSPWLEAHATDAGSGIDPAGWQVLVDGAPSALQASGDVLAGPLGMLVAGTHNITVIAHDRSHNVASVTRTYVANVDGGPASAAVGGSSGLYLVQGAGTLRHGDRGRVVVLAALAGRPLGGRRVELRRNTTVLGAATTDAHGVATIGFVARTPGAAQLAADTSDVAAISTRIDVAPRIRLRASTRHPRRGEPVQLRGRVAPGRRGRRLVVMARLDGSWYPVRRSVRVGAGGAFHTEVASAVGGTVAVRVRLAAGGGWAEGRSNVVVLHVA